MKAELDLSNHATNTNLKGATRIDAFTLASKIYLVSFKTKCDKLKTFPADLSRLRNVVYNDVVKKTEYGKLVTQNQYY